MMYTSYCQKMSHSASAYQAEASFACAYTSNAIARIVDAIIVASIIICAVVCLAIVRVSLAVSVVIVLVAVSVRSDTHMPIMRTRV